ncbi:MAG: hypothetical protein RIT81_09990 [Deltaproteobacteria bacterium]
MNTARRRRAHPRSSVERRAAAPVPKAAPKAKPAPAKLRAVSRQPSTSIARAVGASRAQLVATATIARRTLLAGGLEPARRLFAGLVVLDPTDAHFALGLALANDRLGRHADAHRWYHRAAQLDPTDGHADVDRAELCLANDDVATAKKLLARGFDRARRRGDEALAKKARAMLTALNAR